MPAKSKAQWSMMQGIAHGSIRPKGGLTKGKAAEFVAGKSPKGLPKKVKAKRKKKARWSEKIK